ncbi:L,D-transpeptidase [Billgrantia kenyensis]|uniref:L,D-transpeptidase n=1 Tax=Billgrantia kenyensis TaxID=321266 RepID=A0A7V9W2L4_9GAMM|nr:L,D-transpeptidase [Halomonas kenyensis]MBA2779832.1 L,D-transpeptidase [Halomonas kenyensis]MCG6662233.1 L,D-transpeptidase [Halomonas kenyensis]
MDRAFFQAAALTAGFFALGPAAQANIPDSSHTLNGVMPELPTLWQVLDAVAQPEGLTADEVWLSIDLRNRRVRVLRGEHEIKRIEHLAFGAGGAAPLRAKGSSMTPIGEFRVDRINRASRFDLFFGFDYPNAQVAEEALSSGKITLQEYWYIENYRARHGRAPHTTALGGLIGIHGLGQGDPDVHSSFDWTEGCVAVNNEEIRALDPWLRIGTRVVIKG